MIHFDAGCKRDFKTKSNHISPDNTTLIFYRNRNSQSDKIQHFPAKSEGEISILFCVTDLWCSFVVYLQ